MYAPEGTIKHYFIRIFRIALLQESHIARNKVTDGKKIELSVENSVKSYAIVFGYRTEQNRTVSLLISGHIHDIEIQCEQQNVIYKGLGIFFSLLNTELLYR